MEKIVSFVLSFVLAFGNVVLCEADTRRKSNVSSANEETIEDSICFGEGSYSSLETNETHFEQGEIIESSFKVNSVNDDCIIGFEYENVGFSVLSIEINENDASVIDFSIACSSDSGYHSLEMVLHMECGEKITANLYALTNAYGTFISTYSCDYTDIVYYDYAKDTGIISQAEYDEIHKNLARSCLNESYSVKAVAPSDVSTFAATAADTYVSGYLTWTDHNNHVHALRRIKVEVYDDDAIGEELIATAYTDDYGYFSVGFENADGFWDFEDGGYDVFLKLYAGDNYVMVKDANGTAYTTETAPIENIETGYNYEATLDIFVKSGTQTGQAFQISQAMLTARTLAEDLLANYPAPVSVVYPSGNISRYSYDNSTIYIPASATVDDPGVPYPYMAWDELMHEYGHHLQHQIGFTSVGLEHYVDKDQAERYGKETGIKLAWIEGWATAFALMAQKYSAAFISNVDKVNDNCYSTSTLTNEYNIEEGQLDPIGESNELSVVTVLWDIYDSSYEEDDSISIGIPGFWNVTKHNYAKTLSEFVASFYQLYPSKKSDLGKILSSENIAAKGLDIFNFSSVASGTALPEFLWKGRGMPAPLLNNKFNLVFYNSSGIEIVRTADIIASGNYITHTITQAEWNSIIAASGDTFGVAVIAYQTDTPLTGPYYSQTYYFDKP